MADVEGEEVERSDHKLAVMPAVKPHRESNCDEAGGREGDQNQERGGGGWGGGDLVMRCKDWA